MKHYWISRVTRLLTIAAILIVSHGMFVQSLAAQRGRNLDPDGPTPRLADGTPNLGRTLIGKGIWDNPHGTLDYLEVLIDPPKEQGIPYQPWAKALHEERAITEREDPQGFCIPPPISYTRARPMELLQLPEQKRIILISEFPSHAWHEIYMDGRPHPPQEELENFPSFTGHSIGRWEGDTLIVDTVGFNEGTWLDRVGDPHTDQMHLVQKFTRTSLNNMHVEVTIEDPEAYTRPWTIGFDLKNTPGVINEYVCQENNRWQENYIKATKGANGTGNAGANSGHGHPVKGSFVGEWGPNKDAQDTFLLEMDWDGKTIAGNINPGPHGVSITKAELNLANWTLHLEGGTGADRVVLDGKFENVTWIGRSLTGTYTRGNQKGTFKVVRQY